MGIAEPQAYKDFENTKFSELLLTECIAVVKAEYFVDCDKNNVIFKDRAEIPKEFFYTGEEAVKLWKEHGFGFLVMISYGSLAQHHPDPNKYHLRRLVRIIRELKTYHM